MKRTIELMRLGFESSSLKTEQFKGFVRIFKTEFKKELNKIGATNIKISVGHFYISGFFTTATNNIYYFSLSDVRGDYTNGKVNLLYRTAKDYGDYTGGSNQYILLNTDMFLDVRLN